MKMIFNCSKSTSQTVSEMTAVPRIQKNSLQDNTEKEKKREGNPSGPVIDVWMKKTALSGISVFHSVPNVPVEQAQRETNM